MRYIILRLSKRICSIRTPDILQECKDCRWLTTGPVSQVYVYIYYIHVYAPFRKRFFSSRSTECKHKMFIESTKVSYWFSCPRLDKSTLPFIHHKDSVLIVVCFLPQETFWFRHNSPSGLFESKPFVNKGSTYWSIFITNIFFEPCSWPFSTVASWSLELMKLETYTVPNYFF